MTYYISGADRAGPAPRLMGRDFVATVFRPWQLLARKMAERRTRMSLSALDDHLLKDIGISRGIIDRVARNPAAPTASPAGQGNRHS